MKLKIISTLFLMLVTILMYSQNSNNNQEYNYVTVTVDQTKPKNIYISYSNGDFEKQKIEGKGFYDYSNVLKIIQKMESDGFELFSNTFSKGAVGYETHNYFLLRKKVEDNSEELKK